MMWNKTKIGISLKNNLTAVDKKSIFREIKYSKINVLIKLNQQNSIYGHTLTKMSINSCFEKRCYGNN